MGDIKKVKVNNVIYTLDLGDGTAAEAAVEAAEAAAAGANAAAGVALSAASKAPYIGQNGNWWVWDSTAASGEGAYVDTNISADPETAKADKVDVDNLEDVVDNLEENPSDYAQVANFEQLPKLAGQPSILFCDGTPSSSNKPTNWIDFMQGGYEWTGRPSAIGQQLLDYTNHITYYGWLNPANYQLDWKH